MISPVNSVQLSVVIPCFNSESTIEKLLQQLGQQTLASDQYEIIVVDDGSDDKTPNLVCKFQNVYLIQQDRSGPGNARMLGIKYAVGNYVLFLDSDLEVSNNLLEKHLSYHIKYPDIAATGGSVIPIGNLSLFSWELTDHFSSWFNAHPNVKYKTPPEYLPSLNFCIKKKSWNTIFTGLAG